VLQRPLAAVEFYASWDLPDRLDELVLNPDNRLTLRFAPPHNRGPGSSVLPVIEFRSVSKRFGDVLAVADNDLAVEPGEFLSILGPSGCGKTTSLRMMAGFEQPTSGTVLINGEDMTGTPAYRRPVNMVFQHYALFPHLTVADNVSYGLRQRRPKPPKPELSKAVKQALAMVRLDGFEQRRTWELSGGQQQRVALARALINRPSVLLLDEPLAALDRKLRRDMQIELQNLQRDVGITFLLVTHDQEEALSMSDRVCIMREGRIVQIGSPRQLYDEPCNSYVADFVGKSNFFMGKVGGKANGTIAVVLDDGRSAHGRSPSTANGPLPGEEIVLSVRPELISVAKHPHLLPQHAEVKLAGRVLNRIFLGEHTEYRIAHETLGEFTALSPRQAEREEGTYEIGDTVAAGWRPESALVLVKS
jgi:spermidine/putrescine transport system ATP-binding protein